jgi:hypothetical protein
MKNYLKIASVLSLIALVCAAIIASVYTLTAQMIIDNAAEVELQTRKAIYEAYDKDMSEELESSNSAIRSKILAKDKDGNELGYLYTVSKANSFGSITLMVAIDKDNNILQVEILELNQSFASTAKEHFQQNYPTSKENVIYIGIKPEEAPEVGTLTEADFESINTTCGATYSADMIKELVKTAITDAKGGK